MKRIIGIVLIAILMISCSQSGSEWKGSIEVVDGVTVVKNPKEPMYGPEVFHLEEELSIGEKEGRKEYMFSEIRSIAVDKEENIYVLDYKEAHIKVYNKNGEYQRTIGRHGQGPGEFASPLTIHIYKDNQIMVEDIRTRRFAYFTLEGDFINNITSAKNFFIGAQTDSKGNIYGTIATRDDNPRYEYRKFNSDLEYLQTISKYPLTLNRQTKKYNPFGPMERHLITRKDEIICGYPEKYEIRFLDVQGNLIKKIIKQYDPVEIPEQMIKDIKKRSAPPGYTYDFPKNYCAYFSIQADDIGRIYVGTFEKSNDTTLYDVFDQQGRFLVKIPLKSLPYIIKNGKYYTIETDKDGYQYVKRYKVTWNY